MLTRIPRSHLDLPAEYRENHEPTQSSKVVGRNRLSPFADQIDTDGDLAPQRSIAEPPLGRILEIAAGSQVIVDGSAPAS